VISVRTKTLGERACVEIADTGVGIEAMLIPRLFDPFFTTKPVGQGTGLGLFICKRIIVQHGGELHVQSELGKGTTFSILLPKAASEHAPARRPTSSAPPSAKRFRVLVVDDEPSVGRSLKRALSRDLDVAVTTDAREALDQLSRGADFDVVVCDIMMPEMTGVELYAAVRDVRPELAARMLFFTGGAFTPSAQAFVQRMAGRCLEKPLDIGEIRRLVAEITEAAPTG
jgi:CheY-like chemotaxis protein